VYKTEGYGTWIQEIINPDSGLYSFGPDMVFIVLDGEEMLRGQSESNEIIDVNINYIEEAVKNNPNITFFVSNIDLWTAKIERNPGQRKEGLNSCGKTAFFCCAKNIKIFMFLI